MKRANIVKTSIPRSSSTLDLQQRFSSKASATSSEDLEVPRNLSLSSSKHQLPTRSPSSYHAPTISFIRAKPSLNSLKSSSLKTLHTTSSSQTPRHRESSIQVYASLDDLVSSLTLKSVESMKKEYNKTSNHEIVYRVFLALMSELDSAFNENQVLQFSMSRAREVFALYMSRPGPVLQTLKALPKLAESVRISKSVLSQCRLEMKQVMKQRLKDLALAVYEMCGFIISMQSKIFRARVFVPKDNEPVNIKTQENLLTEERTFDVSIMELHTMPNEIENRAVSPISGFEFEDLHDTPFKPLQLNCDPKGSKAKLLEQLYSKIHNSGIQYELKDSFHGLEENKVNGSQSIEASCLQNVQAITAKRPRRSNSGSPKPNYMRGLRRITDIAGNQTKANLMLNEKQINARNRRIEWEELRKKKKEAEESRRREMLEEIMRKKVEDGEMKQYISEKIKSERSEMLRFKEEEIREMRRIKEVNKLEKKKEMMDEVSRNIEKSQLQKAVPIVFEAMSVEDLNGGIYT